MMRESKPVSVDKLEWPIGVILLLVSAVVLFLSITPGHGWGGDFAAYIHQGKALANGSVDHLRMLVEYRIDHSTTEWIIGPDYYPWGFPAILAVMIVVFGESLFAMKCLGVGFVLGCQVTAYFLFRGRASMLGCYAVAFVFGMNSFIFDQKDRILSDIPFTFFVLLTLLLCRIFLLEKTKPSIANLVGIGITMSAAFCIRTHAIALLPVVAFLQLMGKTDFATQRSLLVLVAALKRVRLADFIPYLIFAACVAAVTAALSDPIEAYTGSGHVQVGPGVLERLFATVKGGILYYGLRPKELFIFSNAVYALIIVPIFFFGVYRAATSNIDLVVFVFFYMLVLLVYPGRQGLRFMLPVLPVFVFFLFVGGRNLATWIRSWRASKTSTSLGDVISIAVLLVGMSGPIAVDAVQERRAGTDDNLYPGPYTPNSRDIFDYIKNNIAKDEGIIFWKPRVLSYLTDRKSSFNFRIEELTNGKHKYVLVYLGEYFVRDKGRFLVETTSAHSDSFRSVYSNPDFVLYEVVAPNAQ